ncbi:unnamed protein product [Clonostachys byssicola]|uniref:Uncharacterized protein n=1 Tax=Clonostachys byssicola TaxID=160290 RepID=A0A9N9U7E4_9HYPO|nr:unnamed protein product [Clonostachys byssicola]
MNVPLVYTGFWINHNGAWKKSWPRLGVAQGHQQQARASHSTAAAFAVLRLFRSIWIWLGKIPGIGLLAYALYIVINAAAFVSYWGGGFQKAGDVLLVDNKCGWPNGPETEAVASSWSRHVLAQGQEYARNCYTPGFFPCCRKPCNVDTPTLLRSFIGDAAPCPFSEDICGQTTAFEIETPEFGIGAREYMNSNEHFGINTAKDGQLRFRSVTKCVPILAEEKHSTPWFEVAWDTHKEYNLGPTESTSFTWVVRKSLVPKPQPTMKNFSPYELRALASYAGFHDNTSISDFSPIDDLMVPHADITVLYLLNIALYSNVTEDPWFQATNKVDRNGFRRDFSWGLGSYYYADRVASTLGCTRQWEFCTMDGSCTSPMGLMEILHNGEGWRERLNPKQAAVLELLSKALELDFSAIVRTLGAGILSANDQQVYQFSAALRPTHWHREIASLHSIELASMQRFLANFPSVPVFPIDGVEGNKTSHDFITEPEGELRSLCGSIRIRSENHTNLNVFWLLLLFMVGLFIFGIRYLLLPLQDVWFHRNFRIRDYPHEQWEEIALLYDREAGALRRKNPTVVVYDDCDSPWTDNI